MPPSFVTHVRESNGAQVVSVRASGSSLSAGQIGKITDSTSGYVTCVLADSTDTGAEEEKYVYILENISAGTNGEGIITGTITGVDTSTYTAPYVWLNASGTLSNTPSGGLVQLGKVNEAAGDGTIWFDGNPRNFDAVKPDFFGADGVGDDAAPLQSAITYAGSSRWLEIDEAYTVGSSLTAASGMRIRGRGSIEMTGSATDLLVVTSRADVQIHGITLIGNQDAGNGIYGTGGSDRLRVDGVTFKNFGASGASGTGDGIHVVDSDNVRVLFCNFQESLGDNASDMFLPQCRRLLLWGNDCTGGNGQGIYEGASGFFGPQTEPMEWSVIGNKIRDKVKHGILLDYSLNSDRPIDASVTGNIITNCGWTGIYMSAGADSIHWTVSGNTISYCGGTQGTGINGGIHAQCPVNATFTGNTIRWSGYNDSGVARTYTASGIRINQYATSTVVASNTISRSSEFGIEAVLTDDTRGLVINGNTVQDCLSNGIQINMNPASSKNIHGQVCNNSVEWIEVTVSAKRGVSVGASTAFPTGEFAVDNNQIRFQSLDATNIGIAWANDELKVGSISGNTVRNAGVGVLFTEVCPHLYIGQKVAVERNQLHGCTDGLRWPGSSDNWAVWGESNVFHACSNNVRSTATANRNIIGTAGMRVRGYAPSLSGAPATGTWAAGDTLQVAAPASAAASIYTYDGSSWLSTGVLT